jgi:hypothetical protein
MVITEKLHAPIHSMLNRSFMRTNCVTPRDRSGWRRRKSMFGKPANGFSELTADDHYERARSLGETSPKELTTRSESVWCLPDRSDIGDREYALFGNEVSPFAGNTPER